jgi:hypothetical protein
LSACTFSACGLRWSLIGINLPSFIRTELIELFAENLHFYWLHFMNHFALSFRDRVA